MAKVLVPLAEGFEELEAVTITDLLTRGGIDVVTAGLADGPVRASRGLTVIPDRSLDAALEDDYAMVVLPGGLPGADHLRDDPRIQRLLRSMAEQGRYTAAICAAPKALSAAGLLAGKRVTAFPTVQDAIRVGDTEVTGSPIEEDGRVITSRGPGTAMDFALRLVEILAGKDQRDAVEASLARP